MVLGPVPAGKAGHHGQRARIDRRGITGGVDRYQFVLRQSRIALIAAIGGAAIGEKMFGRGRNLLAAERLARFQPSLQPQRHRAGIAGDQLWIGGIAFISPAPAHVLRHGECGGEGPLDPAARDFGRGDCADPFDQRRIVRCAKADIVRKDCRAGQVGMAVHGIDPEQDRHARAGLARGCAEIIHQLAPGLRIGALIAAGSGIAACQDRAEWIAGQIGRLDRADIGLDQLANLLFQRHALQQCGNCGFGCGVSQGCGAGSGRPRTGICDCTGFGSAGTRRRYRIAPSQSGRQHQTRDNRPHSLSHPNPMPVGRAVHRRLPVCERSQNNCQQAHEESSGKLGGIINHRCRVSPPVQVRVSAGLCLTIRSAPC